MGTKRLYLILSTIILCVFFSLIQIKSENAYASAKKKYLVLIQNYDGETFVAYDDIIDEKRMVDVKAIVELLYLKYEEYNKNSFIVSKNYNELSSFTIGKKAFNSSIYGMAGKSSEYKPPYAPVKKNNKIYFHYTSLIDLVKYTYFSASKAKEYAKLGYDGIVCYSRYFNVTEVPALDKVYNAKGKLLYPAAAKPTPAPEPAPEILPSNVDSKPSNYLLLTNGYIKSVFDDEKQGYSSFKGLVETIDGHVMVNINLLAEHLYTLKDN